MFIYLHCSPRTATTHSLAHPPPSVLFPSAQIWWVPEASSSVGAASSSAGPLSLSLSLRLLSHSISPVCAVCSTEREREREREREKERVREIEGGGLSLHDSHTDIYTSLALLCSSYWAWL